MTVVGFTSRECDVGVRNNDLLSLLLLRLHRHHHLLTLVVVDVVLGSHKSRGYCTIRDKPTLFSCRLIQKILFI